MSLNGRQDKKRKTVSSQVAIVMGHFECTSNYSLLSVTCCVVFGCCALLYVRFFSVSFVDSVYEFERGCLNVC